jgi:hypothetical protein
MPPIARAGRARVCRSRTVREDMVRSLSTTCLSDTGRQRVQLDADVRRELWKDLFVSLNVYNTYDNRPPNPAAATNDVGIALSIGSTY